MTRTITAFFDTRAEATNAVERLTAAGVPRRDIAVIANDQTAATTHTDEHKGFFESIGDFFMPDEDRYGYEEGIRRGGAVLSVKVADERFDSVSDILEEAGSVDLDTRERDWKAEGWSGYDATTARTTGGSTLAATSASAATRTARSGADDETIDVIEEQLRVGKREVDHGRVRIRSYVVETPVQESVSLRSESVHVERRPVDRAVTDSDKPVFQERVLEAEETGEEAVVSKQARVVEEIGLTKKVQDRVETVSDTVRRTEVEVEDERAGKGVTDKLLTDEERARQRR